MAQLVIENLCVNFHTHTSPVLTNINMVLKPASLTLLLGANGSGKSVLLHTILGLHKAKSGTISLDGKNIIKNPEYLHRHTGVFFQNPEFQLFEDTVQQDIMLGLGGKQHDNMYRTVIDALDLKNLLSMSPVILSGGMKRKTALAGALVPAPRFLFLDEPFSQLDYPSIIAVLSLLKEAQTRGSAILLSSHESRDVWSLASNVVILHKGAVIYAGSPKQSLPYIMPQYGLRPHEI